MLTVHHLENSRSLRVIWLLEELDADYEVEHYERDPETGLAPDELRDVHPLGKSPVVTDDDRTVAESAVILEHLLDTRGEGELRPESGSEASSRYRYWMHYAEGSAMPVLLLKLVFSELPERAPWGVGAALSLVTDGVSSEFIDPRLDRHIDFWRGELAEREYFAGDAFTAADIQMSFPVAGALQFRGEATDVASLEQYLERLRDRPAYQRALDRTGGSHPFENA